MPYGISIKEFTYSFDQTVNPSTYDGSKTKLMEALLCEFLFADDYALTIHSHEDIQCIMDHISNACKHFGFAINLSKTEAMYQPALQSPSIVINGMEIKRVEKFCYLGSTVHNDGFLDAEGT